MILLHLQEIYGQAEFSKHDAPSIALNRQGHYYTHNLLLTLQSKIIGTNPYRTAIEADNAHTKPS